MPDHPFPALARGRQLTFMILAGVIAVPGVVLSRIHEPSLPDVSLALLFGLAVIGAAFMLSWAAEAAQLDISAGLAIAVLAFIAVPAVIGYAAFWLAAIPLRTRGRVALLFAVAPIAVVAKSVSYRLGWLAPMYATRSPRATPSERSRSASRDERAASSA